MNQMKKISKNITSNIMKNMRLQYVRTSLAKITAVMVVTMTVLAQSLIAEAQEAEPETRSNVFRDGDDEQAADTLLLTEVEPAPERSVWTLNGALLRRMTLWCCP
jgi:hypothetical protein